MSGPSVYFGGKIAYFAMQIGQYLEQFMNLGNWSAQLEKMEKFMS